MSRRYDLHTHSVHSDGTTTPTAIAREAAALGLAGFALTDHDTTDGWAEGRSAAAESGIEFLPGMEITTRDAGRSTHLLAYGARPDAPELAGALRRVRDSRVGRAQEMVRRLGADFDIRWHSVVEDEAAGRTVGRPHIADALVQAGYFTDRSEAFSRVLGPGSPYYVDTYAIDTAEAIRMVRDAGGVPVLAHPAAGRHSRSVDPAALERFVRAGLWGIELDHPENRSEWLPGLARLAAVHGLRVTGASDYHGAGKPNLLGERTSPEAIWEAVRAIAAIPR
ncbi:PHP domain-containing protein [Leucobacter weissii]|uniref:PHP domain-containing protein n=1 Tax=Leucobacter weissii TaxID=1983706 RepID=A0A939S9P6_9MICO|nr:PHP domain-containing protein [Leucobacter weissii]MBO1901137.1 PHP domain-containing protein [Leucobacter weissii]